MNLRYLNEIFGGLRDAAPNPQLKYGPNRLSNQDFNFLTSLDCFEKNNLFQIMDAQKNQNIFKENNMTKKQRDIILQIQEKNISKKKQIIYEEKKIQKSEDNQNHQKEFKKRLLKKRKENLIVPASSKNKQLSQNVYQNLIPTQEYDQILVSDSRVYGGRFTSKGNLYYCSSQSHIGLFNTQDPYKWQQLSMIEALNIRWTVTDMDVDKDEKFLIYSSISSEVHLVDLATLYTKHEKLSFKIPGNRIMDDGWGNSISLFSIKFSGDSKEVLGGSRERQILIYDMMQNKVSTVVEGAHQDDINSVCWANRESSNILFTGSDDCFVKVWDRRALGSSNKPAGIFVGHQEGVAHVTSKGDGIYLASNAKDQLLKVWDIRKMVDYVTFKNKLEPLRRSRGFDYRNQDYPFKNKTQKHPQDQSIYSFKGHTVISTLIRCQFSPIETTGQRYIYTGSGNGKIHIYDLLTGDTAMTLPQQGFSSGPDPYGHRRQQGVPCRDVSWHPHKPILASTSFDQTVKIWTLQDNRSLFKIPESYPRVEEIESDNESVTDDSDLCEEERDLKMRERRSKQESKKNEKKGEQEIDWGKKYQDQQIRRLMTFFLGQQNNSSQNVDQNEEMHDDDFVEDEGDEEYDEEENIDQSNNQEISTQNIADLQDFAVERIDFDQLIQSNQDQAQQIPSQQSQQDDELFHSFEQNQDQVEEESKTEEEL